MPSKLTINADY